MLLDLQLIVSDKLRHDLLLHVVARLHHGLDVLLQTGELLVQVECMRTMQIVNYGQRVRRREKLGRRNIVVICIYVAYQQEGFEIDSLPLAYFPYGILAESQTDSQTGKDIEKLEIDIDKVGKLHRFGKDDSLYLSSHIADFSVQR